MSCWWTHCVQTFTSRTVVMQERLLPRQLCVKSVLPSIVACQKLLRPVQTIKRVLRHSRCGSHEHDVRKFEKKCLWHKLPLRLGRTSILRQGMPLCSSWKPTIFGSFHGNTALSRNIFIACSQHVCWLSILANIMFLASASGYAAEYVP